MNLKLITAAVLALVAVAPAHADINTGASGSGNGELFLSVWNNMGTVDASDDLSITLDLGISLNNFASFAATPVAVAPQPTYLYNDAAVASFLGGATASNVYWNILGFDSISADRIITTASIGYDMGNGKISNMTVAELRTVTGIGQGYLANVNAVLTGAADTLNNGTASFVSADTGFAGDSTFGTNIGATSVDFNTAANLGNSMGFFMISETSASAAATTRVTNLQFADRVWNLATDGTLTYAAAAPVPEADTYALMLAGLGLVGFLARRRKAA